jgi:hypothetical protein
MSQEISKHVKITYYCSLCKKNLITKRDVVKVPAAFNITDIKEALKINPLTKCSKHLVYTQNEVSFYHTEKLN